jgi:hypothetical protein
MWPEEPGLADVISQRSETQASGPRSSRERIMIRKVCNSAPVMVLDDFDKP